MWISYKDEIKGISNKIINDYLDQADIMADNMRRVLSGIDGTYEKILIEAISNTKKNNTFENQLFLKNFLRDDIDTNIIDKMELSMYEGLLKISTVLLEQYLMDFVNVLRKQNLSNRKKDEIISEFMDENSSSMKDFADKLILEIGLELTEEMEKIKLLYLVKFIEDNSDDFFIEYGEHEYKVGITEKGLNKSLIEMNEKGIKTTPEENILIKKNLGYIKEEEIIEDSNILQNYISDYKMLNKLALDNGFCLNRVSGSHGIFENKSGKIIIIPQGRSIGKGLSLKIQKDIRE